MKACKDCKHSDAWNTCVAPQLIRTFIDPKTGARTTEQTTARCKYMREGGRIISFLNNTCGERARWFEAKDGK